MRGHNIRVAIYGNNLNQGYYFARQFSQLGIEARLFLPKYHYRQEHNSWWEKGDVDSSLIRPLDFELAFPTLTEIVKPSQELPHIAALYEEVKDYDVIFMMENGPAIFSDLPGPKKIFCAQGADLQIIPFYLKVLFPFRKILTQYFAKRSFERTDFFRLGKFYKIYQEKQRLGLRQCDVLICSPHQESLLRQLRLDTRKVSYLTLPIDEKIYGEQDETVVDALKAKYREFDLVFFHPARQFFLKLDGNRFMKDNDKLFRAFARFISQTNLRVRLVALEKGREQDLLRAKQLVKELGLENHVEWLPEMENVQLRAYYKLDNLVVCDQFSPNLATLGNIGREASFFGKLLITGYREWNQRLLYGSDTPPHIYPATSDKQIFDAMVAISQIEQERVVKISEDARAWYKRNLHLDIIIPKYVDIIRRCVDGVPLNDPHI